MAGSCLDKIRRTRNAYTNLSSFLSLPTSSSGESQPIRLTVSLQPGPPPPTQPNLKPPLGRSWGTVWRHSVRQALLSAMRARLAHWPMRRSCVLLTPLSKEETETHTGAHYHSCRAHPEPKSQCLSQRKCRCRGSHTARDLSPVSWWDVLG